jgi:hypothetical protein
MYYSTTAADVKIKSNMEQQIAIGNNSARMVIFSIEEVINLVPGEADPSAVNERLSHDRIVIFSDLFDISIG